MDAWTLHTSPVPVTKTLPPLNSLFGTMLWLTPKAKGPFEVLNQPWIQEKQGEKEKYRGTQGAGRMRGGEAGKDQREGWRGEEALGFVSTPGQTLPWRMT